MQPGAPRTDAPAAPRTQAAADLTRENVRTMRRLEEVESSRQSLADRVAAFIAKFCGSMTFVWCHVAIFAAWISWNSVPGFHHFDPYPFTFLTLCVSLEAIFLSSFILISQNYEMRITERRNRLDLQIDLLSEQENTKMLQLLEGISLKVGATSREDPELRALEQATRPEQLAREIDDAFGDGTPGPTPAPPPAA
jgi:uncharacterized membrane protein